LIGHFRRRRLAGHCLLGAQVAKKILGPVRQK